jgi:hypothetical protein
VEMNLGRPVLLAGLDRDCEAHNGGEYRHRVLVMTQLTPFPRFIAGTPSGGCLLPSAGGAETTPGLCRCQPG